MFEYKGYHFTPSRRLPKSWDLYKITKHTRTCDIGLSNYGGDGFDYAEFYEKSTDKEADIFLCEETGKEYIPSQNQLFLFV